MLLSQEERKVKMSKLLIKINDDKELTYDIDGFILGLNNYSICFYKYYDIDQIKYNYNMGLLKYNIDLLS